MVKIKSSESFSFDNCQEKNLEYIRVSSYEQKRKFSWCQMSYIEQSKCPCTTAPSIERSLLKIQFDKLDVSKLIFQKSSTDQQRERQDHLNVKFIRWHRNLPLFCFCICELQPPGWSVLCPLWQWLEGLFVCIDCSSIWFCLLRSSL